jgi:hypothetical protein
MGFFDRRRKAKALRDAEATAAASEQKALNAHIALQSASLDIVPDSAPDIIHKKGELFYLVVNGAGFYEATRQPGQWTGGSQGVSLRVAKGVSYRVGANRGTFKQGAEVMTVTSRGTFYVTNVRCVFVGDRRTAEWPYAKLIGFSLEGDGNVVFNVSNRQKPSGVVFGTAAEPQIDATIAGAIAAFQGEDQHAALVDELRKDATEAQDEAARARAEVKALSTGDAARA